MAGMYIHIPFCRKACHYCDFHFSTSLAKQTQMVDALCKELQAKKSVLAEPLDTLYFGGGTPSLLREEELVNILKVIHENYDTSALQELTLEANPDDLNPKQIKAWKAAGVNRLSVGIQSFHERDLKLMNRSHTVEQAERSVKLLQDNGIVNITVDLIYGLPDQSQEEWIHNLEKVIEMGVPHLSIYGLTVEPKTVLKKWVDNQKVELPNEELVVKQFSEAKKRLEQEGYLHYEVSNYAKKGHLSQHNSSYWKGKSYLGIGPSAHSFYNNQRSWNISNNAVYIKAINNGDTYSSLEVISPEMAYNEYLLTGLRTYWGIDLAVIQERYGINFHKAHGAQMKAYINKKMLKQEANTLTLTASGMLWADRIAADFFIT